MTQMAAHRYEVEALEEAKGALEGEKGQMLERFNEYGEVMQRRQDEVIERVKRELRVKVQEVVARAEVAERERDAERDRVEEIKRVQE